MPESRNESKWPTFGMVDRSPIPGNSIIQRIRQSSILLPYFAFCLQQNFYPPGGSFRLKGQAEGRKIARSSDRYNIARDRRAGQLYAN
jgi:hypothetical protein